MNGKRILVTGGAGFIGSHLVDALMEKEEKVRVIDNLSSGNLENVKRWIGNPRFEFVKGDLLNPEDVMKAVKGCDVVFHLAANPEVRVGSVRPEVHYKQNTAATFNLLEALRKHGEVKTLAFTSSSTVYGEASVIPTPEDYAPLEPISIYGASKLACEALIMSYAHSYGFNAVIYRLANVVGPRSEHGVIYDFFRKLRRNPKELEILGDGTQEKSYLYVKDCVQAMLIGLKSLDRRVDIFNVGSEDQVNVKRIAEIVVEEMGLNDVKFRFTGGVNGGRGWVGDVKKMLLDVSKLKSKGWKARYNSEESVRLAIRSIVGKNDFS